MRYQDRLLKLFPPERPLLAQYLARELEGQVVYFDSGAAVRALRHMAQNSAEPGGTQAALALRRLEPVFLQRIYGRAAAPVQSRLLDASALDELRLDHGLDDTDRLTRQANRETFRRAATMLLEPLVAPLVEVVESSTGPRRRRAMMALSRLLHKRAASCLHEIAQTTDDPDASLAALLASDCTQGRAGEQILELVNKHSNAPGFPGMLLALGAVPSPGALQVLEAVIAADAVSSLPSAAAAAEGFEPAEVEGLLESLCGGGQGWATVNALETLGRLKGRKSLDLVTWTYRRLDHATLRSASVKVAGMIGGEAAEAFLVDVLATRPDPTTAARALEGLIRFRGASSRFTSTFAGYLAHPSPDVAVAAALGLAATDKPRVAKAIRQWLTSVESAWRLEAAYCLGYLQGDFALSLLEKLALCDPDESVRIQSVRSIALYDLEPATVGTLLRIASGQDLPTRMKATQILGNPANEDSKDVFSALARLHETERDSGMAAEIARALGRTGSPLARELLINQARGETDPFRLRGLLDGIDLGSTAVQPSVWRPFVTHESPAVRGAVARGRWHSGDAAGVEALASLLAASAAECELALDEIERITVTAVHLIEEARFAPLKACLRDALHSRTYRDFAASEFSVHLSPERLPSGFDPSGDAGLARRWSSSEEEALSSGDLDGQIERVLQRSAPSGYRPRRSGAALENLDRRVSVLSPARAAMLLFLIVSCAMLAVGSYRRVSFSYTRISEEQAPAVADRRASLRVLGLPRGAKVGTDGTKALRVIPGSAVRPGHLLASSDAGRVVLAGPGGEDRIVLLPGSRLKVDDVIWNKARGTARYTFSLQDAAILLDIAGAQARCSVRVPGGELIAFRGLFFLQSIGDQLAIKVARGRCDLKARSAQGITVLTDGQETELTAGHLAPVRTTDPEEIFQLYRGE